MWINPGCLFNASLKMKHLFKLRTREYLPDEGTTVDQGNMGLGVTGPPPQQNQHTQSGTINSFHKGEIQSETRTFGNFQQHFVERHVSLVVELLGQGECKVVTFL